MPFCIIKHVKGMPSYNQKFSAIVSDTGKVEIKVASNLLLVQYNPVWLSFLRFCSHNTRWWAGEDFYPDLYLWSKIKREEINIGYEALGLNTTLIHWPSLDHKHLGAVAPSESMSSLSHPSDLKWFLWETNGDFWCNRWWIVQSPIPYYLNIWCFHQHQLWPPQFIYIQA